MKCPFLESEDCETCGYYDYVPEKKCYNCLHPFLNADDEKQQDWKKIVSYMRECGYEWSYEHMKHDYQTYYLHNLYCAFSLMDIIANRTVQCMRLFEENVPLEEITRFSEPQAAHMDQEEVKIMFYLKYYKKYFFIVLTVLVILAGFTLWIYRPAHKDNTENTNKKIEKFTKKDEEISYQYLSKLALKTKDSFLSPYQLIQGRNGSDSESKAEMDGITMDLKLYSKKEQSVGKLLESEYNNQTKNLSEQSNIQNVKVYDVVKGSGCYIQQIDYEIKNDTTVYPCALYLKIDDVSEDAILDTVITVDNTKSDDKTAAILKEVLSANGIEIK